jgi:hypothetical protein
MKQSSLNFCYNKISIDKSSNIMIILTYNLNVNYHAYTIEFRVIKFKVN